MYLSIYLCIHVSIYLYTCICKLMQSVIIICFFYTSTLVTLSVNFADHNFTISVLQICTQARPSSFKHQLINPFFEPANHRPHDTSKHFIFRLMFHCTGCTLWLYSVDFCLVYLRLRWKVLMCS